MLLQITKNIKTAVIKSIGYGILGSLGLFAFYYLTLLVITKDPTHPVTQMGLYQLWMSLLIVGFGIQVGIYSLLRNGIQISFNPNENKEAAAVTGAGAAVSGFSMAACCAHHVVDLFPILGLSGAAIFLTEYQKELLIVGVIANIFGIVIMTWMLLGKQKPKIIFNYLLSRRTGR